jgi:membrane-associated PAP2 superfamily phosphatase
MDMTHSPHQAIGWQADRRFWLLHFWLPLAVSGFFLYSVEQTSIDLWLADQWFALQGGEWAWRSHWVSYDLIHHHGKQLIISIGLVTLSLIIASFFWKKVRYWRMPMSYLLSSMALVPAAVASFKRISPVDCPWDLSRYGGELPYVRNFDHVFTFTDAGHCFPAGHASGGFILLSMYFAAVPYARKPAWFLLPGLIVGWTFALGQQSRGAHFISHDLWTLSICWFGALGMFLLFRPQRWPVQVPDKSRQVQHVDDEPYLATSITEKAATTP